ncbi:hypothetical protein ACFU9V_37750, partial [Streptomyces sp. NPDC057557]
ARPGARAWRVRPAGGRAGGGPHLPPPTKTETPLTAATYQCVDLPDASVVTTRALLTARENITDTVGARAMMCIHGGAGFGKTLAVNICPRGLEPHEDVRKITFRARPTAHAQTAPGFVDLWEQRSSTGSGVSR